MPRPDLRSLLLPLVLVLAGEPAAAEEILVDGIAAQVGTDIVLVSEVMNTVRPSEQRMRAAGAPDLEIAKLRAEGLEQLIEVRLIERIVRDTELYATEEEVDKTINAIAEENGISTNQLRQSLEAQGMSYDQYRVQIKREIERRKVVNAMVAARVNLEEKEVKAAYEAQFAEQPQGGNTLHLRQILVPAGEEVKRSMEESCTLVAMLRERVARGESFEELAREYSAAAPEHGGDIGWLHEDQLATWMTAATSRIEEGGVSRVIQLPFGCTIVQVAERKAYEPMTYEKAKPMLHAQLFEEKLAVEYRDWMEDLRDRTFIERRGYFADAARLGTQSQRSRSAGP